VADKTRIMPINNINDRMAEGVTTLRRRP